MRLITGLALAVALAGPSAAHAVTTWTQIANAPSQILDVDADHILFVASAKQLAILDRSTGSVTNIPAPPVPEDHKHVVAGFLSPHGALVATRSPSSKFNPGRLDEWRDGALQLLDDPVADRSLTVVGDTAIWVDWDGRIFRRDLGAGTTLDLGPGQGDVNGVAPNGDVVWRNDGIWRRRASDGVVEQLATAGNPTEESPLTDGINVLWWLNQSPAADLQGVGPGNTPLADFTGVPPGGTGPHVGYAVDGGWIAYRRGGSTEPDSIWRRAPGTAEDVRVTPESEQDGSILGLNDEGEVLFANFPGLGEWFAAPGEDPIRVGRASGLAHEGNRGRGNHVFSAGGLWYSAVGGVVSRLQEGDAPVPGAQTTIDDGPQGVVEASSVEPFAFSAGPGAEFECTLDGGAWEACSSPKAYPPFADGLHTFMVRTVEPGGEVEPEPASQAWVVDTAAPVTSLEWPADGSAGRDPTPGVGGHAGTAYGDGDVTLEIWAGPDPGAGAPIRTFTRTPAPDGLWQVGEVEPALAEGVYTARARQTDLAGNTTHSAPSTFTVDTTPPEPFDLLAPADGAIVGPDPTFTWEETTDGGSGIERYDLLVILPPSTGQEVATTSCTGGVCSRSLPAPLAHGEYVWLVRALDRAGNVAVTAESRDLVVDATPPAPFSLTGPADGARTTDTTPTLAWEATTDDLAGMGGYDVLVDGNRVASGLTATEHTLSEPLADGPHAWRVEAIDDVGNARSSATRTVVVDTTAPTAALAAAPNPVLAGDAVVLDASGSSDPFAGPIVRYEWDADGDGVFEADTGATPTHATSYGVGEQLPVVRVTDAVGHTDTAAAGVSARPVPLPGFAGVSIDNGARFTNDPDVTVRVVWPPLSNAVVLSNDGGFVESTTFALAAEIPWTLDSSGAERLPRTIYARFLGLPAARETYQDDIILDETPPRVVRAAVAPTRRARRFRLRVAGRDNLSGVRLMQVTNDGRRPGRARPYRRRLIVRARSAKLFVRVRDGAGNWSRWRLARRV